MNFEPLDAVNAAAMDPVARARQSQERLSAAEMSLDVQAAATASPTLGRAVEQPSAGAGVLDLKGLYGQFSDGLGHGFYAPDINRLWQKVEAAQQPGSGVTAGEITTELLNVQAKIGIADACAKISTKLVEGLQALIMKQG